MLLVGAFQNTEGFLVLGSEKNVFFLLRTVSARDLAEAGPSSSTSSTPIDLSGMENYYITQENTRLKEAIAKGEGRLSYSSIKNCNNTVFHYTGLPNADTFDVIYAMLLRFPVKYFCGNVEAISVEDQLLCTLLKLRLNLTNFDLGIRFKLSDTTIRNIFMTYLHALHEILYVGCNKKIPSREKNKIGIPSAFAGFPNTRIIIDCTEIQVVIPTRLDDQKAVFSQYKQRHTYKVLLGISPNATITFVSDLFPGSSSDKMITEKSNVLSHMTAGDLILCDKGFLITDLCRPLGVNVNIPPFLTNPQFTKQEVIRTRQIARARVHVERAIGRLKKYRILNFMPSNLKQYSTKIVQVCAVLVNFQFTLLKENEQNYGIDDE